MRITDLLEGKQFNDLDFVRQDGDTTVIDYDLVEDLTFFLNNDDDIYRRHLYPVVHKCVEGIKNNRKIDPSIFRDVAVEGYKQYVQKFPIRQLPEELDDKMCKQICKKIHEDICKHVEEGKYKD